MLWYNIPKLRYKNAYAPVSERSTLKRNRRMTRSLLHESPRAMRPFFL